MEVRVYRYWYAFAICWIWVRRWVSVARRGLTFHFGSDLGGGKDRKEKGGRHFVRHKSKITGSQMQCGACDGPPA